MEIRWARFRPAGTCTIRIVSERCPASGLAAAQVGADQQVVERAGEPAGRSCRAAGSSRVPGHAGLVPVGQRPRSPKPAAPAISTSAIRCPSGTFGQRGVRRSPHRTAAVRPREATNRRGGRGSGCSEVTRLALNVTASPDPCRVGPSHHWPEAGLPCSGVCSLTPVLLGGRPRSGWRDELGELVVLDRLEHLQADR